MNHIIFAAATHDVSIAQNLLEECDCYYFSDSIRDQRMYFDYKLKPGIIKTTNAIRMLEILGIPESVIIMSRNLLHKKTISRKF